MSSLPLREIPFQALAERMDARNRRIPLEGTVETTFRCNLRCAHCYVNEAADDAEVRSRELSFERLTRLIDEIVERGTLFLLLTGGEVLLRPDFPDLYVYAVKRGLLVTIFTNGTLVTDRIADLFARYPPRKIEISLYGMTRETYERVTQVPGSYDRCLRGIERLRERGVRFELKTMALAWNYDEIPAMEAYAQSLGVPFRFDTHLNPRVDCGANRNSELQLDAERAIALDLYNPERLRDIQKFCEKYTRPEPARGPTEYVYNCGAGQSTFTVDPYGRLQMCQLSRRKFVPIRDASFQEAWDLRIPEFRSRKWQSNSVCRSCNLIALCASCPGAAEMETGDIETIVPQFCRITHRRAYAAMGADCGHREDAGCCLGDGRALAAADAARSAGGCGACSHDPERTPLLQIERRVGSARQTP
jgi:radical SAM protein with 4Fe4S-binding SPASM domain